jgi:hypothetical protein
MIPRGLWKRDSEKMLEDVVPESFELCYKERKEAVDGVFLRRGSGFKTSRLPTQAGHQEMSHEPGVDLDFGRPTEMWGT